MKRFIYLFALLAVSLPAFAAHQVSLTWTQTTDPVALNCVFKSATKGGESVTNPLFCSTSPITAYNDTAVVAGDTWYYTVDAVSAKGVASPFSNEATSVVPLLSPTNLQAPAQ
jgi:fibronectin type 3 domain-containing protein